MGTAPPPQHPCEPAPPAAHDSAVERDYGTDKTVKAGEEERAKDGKEMRRSGRHTDQLGGGRLEGEGERGGGRVGVVIGGMGSDVRNSRDRCIVRLRGSWGLDIRGPLFGVGNLVSEVGSGLG